MTNLQQEEFVEGYVRHLEDLLESYSSYIMEIESILTEKQKSILRSTRR